MRVPILDGSFLRHGNQSFTLGGDNFGEPPTYFSWDPAAQGAYRFYTDMHLAEGAQAIGQRAAIILEPRNLYRLDVASWKRMLDGYCYVLTYYRHLLDRGNALFYPLGGSWIAPDDWGMQSKTKAVSMISSTKQYAPGHKIRHHIAARFSDWLDLFGRGINPIPSKIEGLAPYRFSVVVESFRGDYYFSEKLIDCLAVGTIPIYWGCPSIGDFFNMDGIISFTTLEELGGILYTIHDDPDWAYQDRWEAAAENLNLAQEYRCAEDYIWMKYPYLFEGGFDET